MPDQPTAPRRPSDEERPTLKLIRAWWRRNHTFEILPVTRQAWDELDAAIRADERALLAKQAPRVAYEKREAERKAYHAGGLYIRHVDQMYPALPNPDALPAIPVWTRPSDGRRFRLSLKQWQHDDSRYGWMDGIQPICHTLADVRSLFEYWTARDA